MKIGEFIRKKREEKGCSISYISHRVGLAPSTIKLIEDGEARLRLETAIKLSKALEFSMDELVRECTDDMHIEV